MINKTAQIRFVNLTPHPINLQLTNGQMIAIISTGVVRCAEVIEKLGDQPIDGMPEGADVPIIKKTLGDLVGLPDPTENVGYIVSLAAAEKAWRLGRRDVFAIGETIRDEQGRIIGAKSLSANPY